MEKNIEAGSQGANVSPLTDGNESLFENIPGTIQTTKEIPESTFEGPGLGFRV